MLSIMIGKDRTISNCTNVCRVLSIHIIGTNDTLGLNSTSLKIHLAGLELYLAAIHTKFLIPFFYGLIIIKPRMILVAEDVINRR